MAETYTELTYMYRDEGNYKDLQVVWVRGELTWDHLRPYLVGGTDFVPSLVGLDDAVREPADYHELVGVSVQRLEEAPVALWGDVARLLAKFAEVAEDMRSKDYVLWYLDAPYVKEAPAVPFIVRLDGRELQAVFYTYLAQDAVPGALRRAVLQWAKRTKPEKPTLDKLLGERDGLAYLARQGIFRVDLRIPPSSLPFDLDQPLCEESENATAKD